MRTALLQVKEELGAEAVIMSNKKVAGGVEIVAAIDEQVAGPAAAAWIAENTAKGLPAQELYDLVSTMIAGQS